MLLPALFMDEEAEVLLDDAILHRHLMEEVSGYGSQASFLTLPCSNLPTEHLHLAACCLAFTVGEFL